MVRYFFPVVLTLDIRQEMRFKEENEEKRINYTHD